MSSSNTQSLSKAKAKELNGLMGQLMLLGAKENGAENLDDHRDMHGLLERIRRLEPKLPITNGARRKDNVDKFTKWATANGCQISGVQIVEQYGGLGLQATGRMADGECCIEVPQSLFFYVQNGPRFKKLIDAMPSAMLREHGNIMLALALIVERSRKDSFWKPYFDVLPDRYSTPLYYTPADMLELRNTEAFPMALKLCKSIARQYGFIRMFVQDKLDELQNNFTYDVFRWAVSTVMTRQNKVPVNLANFEGLESTLALIPYWDMANHNFAHVPAMEAVEPRYFADTVYNAETEQLECFIVKQPMEPEGVAGSPIFISYGNRTDAEFLVHNGFVPKHNIHATVLKPFKLRPEDPLHKERAHLLELINVPTDGLFGLGHFAYERLSPELVAFVRILAMDRGALESYTAKDLPELADLTVQSFQQPFSEREKCVLALLVTRALREYPTTLEEDEELLKDNRMHPIRQQLIQYRHVEKMVLQRYMWSKVQSKDKPVLGGANIIGQELNNGRA